MLMSKSERIRLSWIEIKSFDISVSNAPRIETMAFLEKYFDVHFLTAWRDNPVKVKIGGHPIQYLPQFGRGIVQKISRRMMMNSATRKYIGGISPDVILLNCINNFGLVDSVYKASVINKCKCVLDIRTLPTSKNAERSWRIFEKIVNFASRYYDGITYITNELRQYCIRQYNLPKHLSAIWSSGVNEELFKEKRKQANDNEFRLIYHGGVIGVSRGLDRLIQAIDQVRDLDIHLTLISSLRERAAIEWIDRLKLHDLITVMDTVPYEQVPGEIQRCHVGILPFPNRAVWNTSSPIKLFEYLSCGKPVIVTDIPAHRNVLGKKPFAFFAADSSPEGLAKSIRNAFSCRDRFKELGKMARRHVLENYTWKIQGEILKGFLEDILDYK